MPFHEELWYAMLKTSFNSSSCITDERHPDGGDIPCAGSQYRGPGIPGGRQASLQSHENDPMRTWTLSTHKSFVVPSRQRCVVGKDVLSARQLWIFASAGNKSNPINSGGTFPYLSHQTGVNRACAGKHIFRWYDNPKRCLLKFCLQTQPQVATTGNAASSPSFESDVELAAIACHPDQYWAIGTSSSVHPNSEDQRPKWIMCTFVCQTNSRKLIVSLRCCFHAGF